jgi:hypothetical protein
VCGVASRLDGDGCNQCTGTDDDGDVSYGHDDTIEPIAGAVEARRQLNQGYIDGYVGAELKFTVTAPVPAGEDPLEVMAAVESGIVNYFADEDESCSTWVTRARALGADVDEDTHVAFSEPRVEEDSVHISRPGDFLNHHYNSNSDVRLGVWLGVSVAGIALMVSARYGAKAYRLKHDADVIEQEKAATWANAEESAGDITMNPLGAAGGGGGGGEPGAGAGAGAEDAL